MSRSRTRRGRGLPRRRLLYVAVFLLSALVGSAFVRVTVQDNAIARERAVAAAEIAVAEAQNAALRAEVAMHETPAYVEERARDYGYVKPGEGLASVRDDSPRSAPSVAVTAGETRLRRWIALFWR